MLHGLSKFFHSVLGFDSLWFLVAVYNQFSLNDVQPLLQARQLGVLGRYNSHQLLDGLLLVVRLILELPKFVAILSGF